MHCSVWRFTGDPVALERGYRELMAQIPASNHVLHAAARTPDGLLIFDTCPSGELGGLEGQRLHGGTGSVSIPYCSIAFATTDGSIVPSSASALSAATTTCWRSTSKNFRSWTR